jgi:hypothetical protein
MLRACVLESPLKWDDCLPLAEFSYSNSYQESIKMSEPGERWFFRLDLVKEIEEKVQCI